MDVNHTRDVIIVGAGLSGLAAATELRKRNIPVTILEASDRVAAPWRARHPQLRLNIHRHFARLPGRLAIRARDTYLPRTSVVDYLCEYADNLDAEIRFDTSVLAVHRDAGIWHIRTSKGAFRAAHLIVATGRERLKSLPDWPGLNDFGGQIIHSADFGKPQDYDGKKVLVIGAGNSGTDVLNHLSRTNPARVWVSVRHGPSILPSRICGFPLHRLANLFACLPHWSLDPTFAMMQRLCFGDLRKYGLRRHAVGGGTRLFKEGITFALDDGFVAALKSGRFEAVAETKGFQPECVELFDGRKLDPDVVICATGYRAGLEPVFGHLGALDANGYPRHPLGQADPRNPGLWFTGYSLYFQGFFHAAGIGAARIASQIAAQPKGQASPKSPIPLSAIAGNMNQPTEPLKAAEQ
ncbi:NAD(P)/FAD-dependent oxidoreductase [uncultured Roseibium sp.]|uniref:flavin-containing monooxygenase n=1 Tax=uncultured Roseibium sp. TaxID=1936171 RepID=UPI002635289B|nr:NAD(P)/FAD-dependent oxidoreductase [uncultured Roseibium sp.]